MTIAYPIARAWLSTGQRDGLSTGAQNYDEFADEAEITAIIAANPASALAVEMPHRAPEGAGQPLPACLPASVQRLAWAKQRRLYAGYDDVAVLYRITGPAGTGRDATPVGYGVWAMVDTGQISTSADQPGLVIRNEDVFPEKVRERVALVQATGHLLSPVLLVQTAHGPALTTAIEAALGRAGAPAARDVDPAGRVHEIWPLPAGPDRAEILALAGGGELVVADGNHRSLAAQTAGLDRFLAVVTTAGSVTIEPYNRLISELTTTPDELWQALERAGARIRQGWYRWCRPAVAGWCCTTPAPGTKWSCRPTRSPTRWTTWTTRWWSGCCYAKRSGWTPATSGSPTSAVTTRPPG